MTIRPFSAGNTPNNPPSESWYGTPEKPFKTSLAEFVWGPVTVDFTLTCEVWKWYPATADGSRGDPYFVFSCDTEGTRVIVPRSDEAIRVAGDKSQQLGASLLAPLEQATLKMGFVDANAELKKRNPQGDQIFGSESETVGFDFGAGFFGKDPTLNASFSWSKTNSMQLTDYLLSSHSTRSHTEHVVSLRMLEGGHKYDPTWSGAYRSEQLASYGAPPTAFEDRELNFSGLWFLPVAQGESATFEVQVDVESVIYVHGISTTSGIDAGDLRWVRRFTVPLTGLDEEEDVR